MRIVQLSDIHLSSTNLEALENFYVSALIDDLKIFHSEKKIDIILLTGDLVDKGGNSLGDNPYEVFNDKFIKPIINSLGISTDKVLFIPGNHDVNGEFIDVENEYYLANKMTKEIANEKIKDRTNKFDSTNKRVEKFKLFEKGFHSNNVGYKYSNNESLTVEDDGTGKVGFALINDSWRCSTDLKKEQHFIGYNQLFNAVKTFKDNKTEINIAVFHHPLEDFNEDEREEIDNILKNQQFNIALFGHSHEYKFENLISSNGGIVTIYGRATFNNPNENDAKFQPGYNVLDIDVKNKNFVLQARKFIKSSGYRFDVDVDSIPGGKYSGKLDSKTEYYNLNTSSSNSDDDLPNGYSADVNRIVKLLIGKSLYPNPNIFVRELIQNAVDACDRKKENNSHLSPRITVNINTEDNYFEVRDEGDGMSKKILKEHFSVIGKSISQEFNDSNGNFNLISQFGIGFISTFIVAQKVYISTKSVNDPLICFEILDVFKGFNYYPTKNYDDDQRDDTGTTIRVYLKNGVHVGNLFAIAKNYSRHIENIDFNVNSVLQTFDYSWNTESGFYYYSQITTKYEVRLAISNIPKSIIASNCGFLISYNSPVIIPFKFPFYIGGEVNFRPKAIDFDISRSNLIENDKSREFRKEISMSLRVLFSNVLESDNKALIQIVLSYLQYYLCTFDTDLQNIQNSYIGFYSKKELILLCEEYLNFNYRNWPTKLSSILSELKRNQIKTIYVCLPGSLDDYQNIVIKYLSDKGNFIFTPKNIAALFRDGQQAINTYTLLQIIALENGLSLVNINDVDPDEIREMKMEKGDLPSSIISVLTVIEKENNLNINIARFSRTSKPVIKYLNEYFINYEHDSFQSLISNANIEEQKIKIYFLGLLGLNIN